MVGANTPSATWMVLVTVVKAVAKPGARPLELGELLRAHREQLGLSQQHLADLSTVSIRTIRNIESGSIRKPRRQTLSMLADTLKLDKISCALLNDAAECAKPTVGFDLRPPYPFSSFVGRLDDRDTITRTLTAGDSRLAVISGLGGVGKSRLAMEVTLRLREQNGWPVLWVPLGESTDAGPIMSAATAISLDAIRGDAGSCAKLAQLIGGNDALIVLDGLQGGDSAEAFAFGLLRACPRLRLLATTAAPWRARGALSLRLAALAVPSRDIWDAPAQLGETESVRLFLERMYQGQTGPSVPMADLEGVAELCCLLDGIPLALELAAARCAELSPELLLHDMITATDGTSDQTVPCEFDPVWEVIGNSCDLLTGSQREHARRLARSGSRWSVENIAVELELSVSAAIDLIDAMAAIGTIRMENRASSPEIVLLNLVRRVLLAPVP
ncbi:helix-turn-helix domain-containing protein [Nonomuraea sp. NPDC051941]|uniref:helix-turn-helix domain-containing protein n=1 Tax=Nonomuraea sp. NPDC051941 TaxID=3364373 RepID=UPI0037C72AEA